MSRPSNIALRRAFAVLPIHFGFLLQGNMNAVVLRQQELGALAAHASKRQLRGSGLYTVEQGGYR
jgi:hypothetical protein